MARRFGDVWRAEVTRKRTSKLEFISLWPGTGKREVKKILQASLAPGEPAAGEEDQRYSRIGSRRRSRSGSRGAPAEGEAEKISRMSKWAED